MEVRYKNKTIKKVCTNYSFARKKYGTEVAEKIHQRIGEIQSIESVQELVHARIGKCHLLKGDRNNQYAMHLKYGYRLVFVKKGTSITVNVVEIQEVVDYH